jgi:DNA-binding GntR family transcriptional regulator
MEPALHLEGLAAAPLADRVVRALRDAINRGELAPGCPLRHAELSERLSVSYAPVREAIRQLAAEGYVTHVPHHGAVVAALCADEIRDLLEISIALETIAIRTAMPNLEPGDLAEAQALHARLVNETDAMGRPEIALEIRMALYRSAGRPWLLHEIERVWRTSARYARLMFASPPGHSESFRSARGILDAFEARDADRAVQFLTEIRTRALSLILDQLGASPNAPETRLFSVVPRHALQLRDSRPRGVSAAGDES